MNIVAPVRSSAIGIFILIILGTLLILVLFSIFASKTNHRNELRLSPLQNKFRVDFIIDKRDFELFDNFLREFSLDNKVLDGFEFELDATSSAKLAFMAPVSIDMSASDDRINFRGKATTSISNGFLERDELKVPSNTNLVVSASDLSEFFFSKFTFPDDIEKWFIDKFKIATGHYFIVFGDEGYFALALKSSDIDLSDLSNVKVDQNSDFYKEEDFEDVTLHLVNAGKSNEDLEVNLVAFEYDGWTYLNSSRLAAEEVLGAIKSDGEIIRFVGKELANGSLAVIYRSNENSELGQNFGDIVLGDIASSAPKEALVAKLAKIEGFEFFLNGREFSGLIDLK